MDRFSPKYWIWFHFPYGLFRCHYSASSLIVRNIETVRLEVNMIELFWNSTGATATEAPDKLHKRSVIFMPISRGFETSRDLVVIRPTVYWEEAAEQSSKQYINSCSDMKYIKFINLSINLCSRTYTMGIMQTDFLYSSWYSHSAQHWYAYFCYSFGVALQ